MTIASFELVGNMMGLVGPMRGAVRSIGTWHMWNIVGWSISQIYIRAPKLCSTGFSYPTPTADFVGLLLGLIFESVKSVVGREWKVVRRKEKGWISVHEETQKCC